MILSRALPCKPLFLIALGTALFVSLLQPALAGAQAIQDYEAPAARHVLSPRGMAPLYHAALLPFLENRVGYAAIDLSASVRVSEDDLTEAYDDPIVGEYGQGGGSARLGTAFVIGSRFGVGLDATIDGRGHDVEGGIFDPVSGVISGSVGVHVFRGWALGASLGAFLSTAQQSVGGPGLDDSEDFFDEVATGLYWSVGFGWSSLERNVSFGWRIVNPAYHDGGLGSTPRRFVAFPDQDSPEERIVLGEIPSPMATEGYFRVAFMENRLSFVMVSRREYHMGSAFELSDDFEVRDFSYLQRDIIAEYAFTNRLAARLGYNRRDENYNEAFSTAGQGILAGASVLLLNTIWDINLSYRTAPRTMAPWSGETTEEFGVGLSLVRNW